MSFADWLDAEQITKSDSPLSTAIDLAARGVLVFPLVGKIPAALTPNGVLNATDDIRTIIGWFRRRPHYNLGIAIGVGALAGVRVLDVDPRHGGDKSIATLEATHGELPETLTVETGRRDGGTHRYYACPAGDYREKICGKDGGVEFLGRGKYVVAATSVHPDTGLTYRVISAPELGIEPAPKWLIDLARRPKHKPAPRSTASNSTTVERARRYLANVPGAISGSGGHTHTFVVASKLVRGFGLGESDAYALLAEWNDRCVPPWSERDLRRKVRQAIEASAMPDGFLRDAVRRAAS